jgi:uncharacterized protein
VITRQLLTQLRGQFRLDWLGIHGIRHWGRVRANGLRLAKTTGADVRVMELFAVFHDARRLNDDRDPDHGRGGGDLAIGCHGRYFELDPAALMLLYRACAGHSHGNTEGNPTVLTCWDADRLDLGRVGIEPNPSRLCTSAARDPAILHWAYRRSVP